MRGLTRCPACIVVMIALLVAVVHVQAEPSERCDDRFYYATPNHAWCIPSDEWESWALVNDESTADLVELFEGLYGRESGDWYTINSQDPIAVLARSPMDRTAIYVELFQLELPLDSYDGPEDLILDITFEVEGETLSFEPREDMCYTVCGVTSAELSQGGNRIWFLYPFEETGEVFMVVLFAPEAVLNDPTLQQELLDIGSSLFITDEPHPDSQTERGNNTANYPIYYGGDITSVEYSYREVQDSSRASATRTESDRIYEVFPLGKWEFLADGKTVRFTPQGIGTVVAAELFPVEGTYSVNNANIAFSNGVLTIEGGELVFELYREHTIGGNTSYVMISGVLDNETWVAQITYTASVGMSSVDVLGGRTQVNTIFAQFEQEMTR